MSTHLRSHICRLENFFLKRPIYGFGLIAIFSLISQGYSYGTATHYIDLVRVNKLLNPALYPGDDFVNILGTYFTILWPLVAFVSKWVSLYWFMFVLHIATRIFLIWSVWKLSFLLWKNIKTSFIAVIFAVFPLHFLNFGMGGSSTFNYLRHAEIVWPILIVCFYFLLSDRWIKSALMLALAFYFHAMFAFFGAFFIFSFFIFSDNNKRLESLFKYFGLVFVLTLPVFFWIYGALSGGSMADTVLRLKINRLRHYTHAMPSGQHFLDWLELAIFGSVAYIIWKYFNNRKENIIRKFDTLLFGSVIYFILNLIFTEIIPIDFVINMENLIALSFFAFFMLMYFAQYARILLEGSHTWQNLSGLYLFVTFVFWQPVILILNLISVITQNHKNKKVFLLIASVYSIFLVYVMFFLNNSLPGFILQFKSKSLLVVLSLLSIAWVLFLLEKKKIIFLWSNIFFVKVAFIYLCLFVLYGAFFVYSNSKTIYFRNGDFAWRETQMWAKNNTSLESLFLTPIGQEGFRIFSQRPIIFEIWDSVGFSWEKKYINIWWSKAQDFYLNFDSIGYDFGRFYSPNYYQSLGQDKLYSIANKYGAKYIVVYSIQEFDHGKLVYENSKYKIYQLDI